MKWRKIKKRFKRYTRPQMIGMMVSYADGKMCSIITDVKIRKAHGKKVTYDISCSPMSWKPIEATLSSHEYAYEKKTISQCKCKIYNTTL